MKFAGLAKAWGFPISFVETAIPRAGPCHPGHGEITEEKLDIVRRTDWILREEVAKAGLDQEIWQYFTVMTGVQTVGVMGDARTYEYVVAVRAVTSRDAMTVEFAELPYELLKVLSTRMVNEVPGCSRVVYDITSKPPATIDGSKRVGVTSAQVRSPSRSVSACVIWQESINLLQVRHRFKGRMQFA